MSSFLPPEIIAKILSKLPVKSVLCFRCVSKPWCSLIDSPDFVKMHLNQSLRVKSNRKVLLGFENFTAHLVELSSIASPGVDSIDSIQRLKTPFYNSVVMNACNGLSLCHAVNKSKITVLYIWNPFTRKYVELPHIPFANEYPPSLTNIRGLPANCELMILEAVKYGFAYISEMDEYKVMQIKEYRGFDWSYFGNEACIFSCTLNRWEKLEPFPYQISSKRVWGAHLNGVFHDVIEAESSQWALMVFDTRSKQHSILPKPEIATRHVDLTVEILEGNLCLFHEQEMNPGDVRVDIWLMKDYGVKDSWFKMLSVAVAVEPDSFMTVYPLAYSVDGAEVLMNYKRKSLRWYSLKGGNVRKVAVNDVPLEFYAEVSFESLVSLPGFISVDDCKAKSQGSDDVNKLKEKGINSWTEEFLSEEFEQYID